jgi:rSAM/selenodomain-associated transferase 2
MNTLDLTKPLLSIIVPVLNEGGQLPDLLENLSRQKLPPAELLIVDGGSTDGSLDWLRQQRATGALPRQVLQAPAGRGRQLNRAVAQARGEWLLLLHADSRFADPEAIHKGLDCLVRTGSRRVAGHFALKFRGLEEGPAAGYYFYEWKARLGRPETIHGDQGFLLRREFLDRIGPFREDLPVMEDTDFAERVRQVGGWLLLPGEISTSARRFAEEGLWQRQLLNAILMCLRSIGYEPFFRAAREAYRQPRNGGKLRVRPFFGLVRRLFAGHSRREQWQLWWQCGCYVRQHAWQLAFARDARRAFSQGVPVGMGRIFLTRNLEPVFDLLTDNPPGRLLATLLLRCWFEASDFGLKRWEQKQPPG